MEHISSIIDTILTNIEVVDERGKTIKRAGQTDRDFRKSNLHPRAQTNEEMGGIC